MTNSAAPLFVLVHSPLVGPYTWAPVAGELERRGVDVLVPAVDAGPPAGRPYWRHQAGSVVRALEVVPRSRPLVLAGHSGAGALLPIVRQLSWRPVAGYLFVDAGIPTNGECRLGPPGSEFEQALRPTLEAGGRFPEWDDAALTAIVPDPERRRCLLAELHPQPLAFWDEPLFVFAAWPDARCAYLHFSPPYDPEAARAERLGWPVQRLEAGHFHMLVDPAAVAEGMLALSRQIGIVP